MLAATQYLRSERQLLNSPIPTLMDIWFLPNFYHQEQHRMRF